jgi:hypothetical protein
MWQPSRTGEHPQRHLAGYAGILQADAHAGFNELYLPSRKAGPITEAAPLAHGPAPRPALSVVHENHTDGAHPRSVISAHSFPSKARSASCSRAPN